MHERRREILKARAHIAAHHTRTGSTPPVPIFFTRPFFTPSVELRRVRSPILCSLPACAARLPDALSGCSLLAYTYGVRMRANCVRVAAPVYL